MKSFEATSFGLGTISTYIQYTEFDPYRMAPRLAAQGIPTAGRQAAD